MTVTEFITENNKKDGSYEQTADHNDAQQHIQEEGLVEDLALVTYKNDIKSTSMMPEIMDESDMSEDTAQVKFSMKVNLLKGGPLGRPWLIFIC
jgi:hypothetical protein